MYHVRLFRCLLDGKSSVTFDSTKIGRTCLEIKFFKEQALKSNWPKAQVSSLHFSIFIWLLKCISTMLKQTLIEY